MSLPFLDKARKTTTIIDNMSVDGTRDASHDEDMPHPELHSAAEDMLNAVHSKDSKALAEAMQRAYNHLSGNSDVSDQK